MEGAKDVRLPIRQRWSWRKDALRRVAKLLPPIARRGGDGLLPGHDSALEQGDADAQLAMQMQAEEDESAGVDITQAWSALALTERKGG
ncbi:hypothetical protein HII31_12285 [Pseudocercospora fuligena]|uniref:Uncharacterized protein n=1 Tax=Pseudocercospora fuligena TaxID=685502 RepID=A0A8H6R759_9PEZI|nr:hypothetical protein HII31_12285 [Pseudocercospora fuligena]